MVSTVQVDQAEIRSSDNGNGVRHTAAIVSDVPATEQVTPLCRLLVKEGFAVDVLSTESLATHPTLVKHYDVAVLDLIRFDGQGQHACRWLRAPNEYLPIIVLCEENTVTDRILGYDNGVDDFIGKPYSAREVTARLRSLMRRSGSLASQHVLRYDDLTIDLASRVAYRGDRYIDLSRREFALLVYFMRSPERAVSRSEFLKSVWGNATNQEKSNVVDVYINYLRNKTEQGGHHRLIHTVRGKGYMLHHKRLA
ncbi:MAG: response regulator transcription factor [Planctomycetes bacterium]|nr:response regulator transcription factor [Planctomycetota bacterium]MCH8969106.1 response regulator transcription factor [Planctomycetota bacterium]